MSRLRRNRAGRRTVRGDLAAGLITCLLAVAACGTGTPALPSGSVTPAMDPVSEVPASVAATAVATTPSSPPVTGGPPSAALTGAGIDAPVLGELGSFTWDGLTSDAPWIVPPTGIQSGPGARVQVSVTPPLASRRWAARWAAIGADGTATSITRDGGSGTAGPIAVTVPAGPGPWSLQVIAAFADGNNGAWYWRLEVGG